MMDEVFGVGVAIGIGIVLFGQHHFFPKSDADTDTDSDPDESYMQLDKMTAGYSPATIRKA